MAKSKSNESEQDFPAQLSSESELITLEISQPTVSIPRKILMNKAFVLSLQMPGQQAAVTSYHREGKTITDKETISNLIASGADFHILEH